MPNYMTELSPDNNTNVYQIKDKEAAPIDLLKDTVGWVGKNFLPITLDLLKANNTSGTWSGNTYTLNGLTWTITTNSDGYVTKIGVNGTSSDRCVFSLFKPSDNLKPNAGSYLASKGNSNTDIPLRQDAYNGNTWVKTLGSVTNNSDVATTIDYNGYDRYSSYIEIASGKTVSNENVYPMLRKASIVDDTYESYHVSVEQTLRDAEVIEGKNVLPVPYRDGKGNTTNGITFTVNSDGSVTANGTATANAFFRLNVNGFKAGEKYILSGCPSGGSDNTYRIQYSNNVNFAYKQYGDDVEITIFDNTIANKELAIYIASGATVNNLVFKPMLRSVDETDSTFEPYYIPLKDSKFDRAEQRVLGAKNLLPIRISDVKSRNTSGTWSGNTYSINGLSYVCTVDDDGYVTDITANGTPSARSDIVLVGFAYKVGVDAILSGSSGGSSGTFKLQMYDSTATKSYDDTGDGVLIPATIKGHTIGVSVITYANVAMNNVTIKPMLRLASDPDDTYVPYAMTNRELTERVNGGWTTEVQVLADTTYGNMYFSENVGMHLAYLRYVGSSTSPSSPVDDNTNINSYATEKPVAEKMTIPMLNDARNMLQVQWADNAVRARRLIMNGSTYSTGFLMYPTKLK